MDVNFTDNSGEALESLRAAMQRGLSEIGLALERYAALKTPVDTGNLRNNISNTVVDDTVYVGTNVEYAPYVEFGTGKYAESGNGRPGWWVYVSDPEGGKKRAASPERKIYTEAEARQIVAILRSKGLDAHMTQGMKPHHMLRDSVSQHIEEYRRIIQRAMQEA